MPTSRSPRILLAGALLLIGAGCGSGDDGFSVSTSETVAAELPTRFRLPGTTSGEEIRSVAAGPATLARELALPGRVRLDDERRAQIAAGVSGTLSHVDVRLGAEVEAGQPLALISSRELARARSAYLEASARHEHALGSFEREEQLWKRKISSEVSYFEKRHALEEARIEELMAGEELLALGADPVELTHLNGSAEDLVEDAGAASFMHHRPSSPLAGVVIAKEAILGGVVAPDTVLFEVADLSTLWVDSQVPAAELGRLETGAQVLVEATGSSRTAEARIGYLDARVEPETQTGLMRLELTNEDGAWRPGLFVTVRAQVGRREVPLSVPVESVHYFPGSAGDADVARVFVQFSSGDFEAREVVLGEAGSSRVEVLRGLRVGELVTVNHGLLLKSVWLGHGGLEE